MLQKKHICKHFIIIFAVGISVAMTQVDAYAEESIAEASQFPDVYGYVMGVIGRY